MTDRATMLRILSLIRIGESVRCPAMRTSTIALVCAVMFAACAWGESSNPPGDPPTPDSGTQQAVCGDGTCAPAEVGQCTMDCGAAGPVCGNANCEAGETNATCAQDCPPAGPVCGDTVCDMVGGENSTNCPGDCMGGGGTLDCAAEDTIIACGLCLIDPMFCLPPATQAECEACLMP
jgi:hypothetical protein